MAEPPKEPPEPRWKGSEDERPNLPDFRCIKGMDPAANWLLEVVPEDFLHEPAQTVIPLLFEPADPAAVTAFKKLQEREGVAVLGFGPGNDPVKEGELTPLLVTREWLRQLLDGSEESRAFLQTNKHLVLSSPMETIADEIGPKPPQLDKQYIYNKGASGKDGVVVAAIDDGFAFAHERFQVGEDWRDGTRIEAFWDMGRGSPSPIPPVGELTKAGIEQRKTDPGINPLITATAVAGIVDEDAVYRRAGQLDYSDCRHKPLAWRTSHGTHVLDLAAGSDPGAGGHPIIAVQLPSPVVARTTGELLDFYVWLGVLYILHRAGDRPVVINVSFGYDAGPHDGGGLLEKHLSLRIGKRPHTSVVLPAGNAQLSRCHAVIDLKDDAEVVLDWIVQPDDRTHSIIEVWLPSESNEGKRLSLTITLPDRTCFDPLTEPEFPTDERLPSVKLLHSGRQMGLAEIWERPDGRRMMRIAIAPTARPQPDPRPLAPAGTWTLRFAQGPKGLDKPAHAWVQRDDSLYGYPQRGRQSYFDHPNYVQFDSFGYEADEDPGPPAPRCPITRKSLLNAIATSENVVVAGGYRIQDCRIARYSSGGPDTPPEDAGRLKPDVLLPSDGSAAHIGIMAAGARSGARVLQDGTSVAAPQLTRYIARWLAAGRPANRGAVERTAAASDVVCQIMTASDRGGHGRLPRRDKDKVPVSRFETNGQPPHRER